MFGSNFRDFVLQDAALQDQSSSERLIKSWHGFEKPDSEDSGIEEEFEVLDSESQEIPAIPCSTSPEDLSLENAILANFPDGCDRSFTVELKDEDSYGIIPKNLTFAEIISILNQAIQEDNCEELDRVVQNIEDYEGRSITLDNENLKDFCSNQLNLELQNRSNHQHIYSNVLSQYKFDQEGFKYDYSVKELVLLAIAANDKLVEQYQDFLFAEENLSLLPLLVGNQKYIEAFIEKFHGTDGVYGRLKGQAIQLVEPNKIGFFSVIALRKEQKLLETVFVEYVLRDFGQVLKTSKPDPLYGVLETASLIKNEEFIMIVLDAFERYINEPTKKASTEELLKKSFATLLETAISQERISVIGYLCKRYTNSADHAIYDVYEQAFADDKVITILRQQILKNIGARGRKKIYDLILKTALDAGNIAFIEHLCKECAECSNDVINYLDHKSKNNEFDEIYESILVALSNTGSQNIIASVLAHVQIYQSIPNNKQQVVRQTIQNILRNAIKEANCKVVVLLCQHVDLKFAALQAIYKEEFEKALPVVAEQLEKTSMELFPSMTRNEYQKNRDTLSHLYLIRSLLESSELINTSSKADIQTQTDTQVNKGSSSGNAVSPIVNVEDTSAMLNETPTSSQAMNGEDNSQLSSQESKSTDSQKVIDKAQETINEYNDDGFTPLHVAAQKGDIEAGKHLLQYGASIEITSTKKVDGVTALHLAVRNGHEDFVKLLLDNGANVNSISSTGSRVTPLHEAAFDGHVDVAKLLINHNAAVDAKDRHNFTPLMYASTQGNSTMVELLLQKEADLYLQNNNGESALHGAADNGHPDVVDVLIGAAEDKEKYVNTQSSNIGTALHIIAYNQEINEGHKKSAKLLLDNGASPCLENDPAINTPQDIFWKRNSLDMAKKQGSKEFLELMSSLGYSVTVDDVPSNSNKGNTTPQNTKMYVMAASALALAGIVSGAAIVVCLEMLAVGIAVGACCLVAAAVIYCCTPKSSVESNNVTKLTGDELAAQQTVN